MVSDPVQERLLALIEEKKRALKPKKTTRKREEPAPQEGSKVVNIMDALRRSLDQSKSRKAG